MQHNSLRPHPQLCGLIAKIYVCIHVHNHKLLWHHTITQLHVKLQVDSFIEPVIICQSHHLAHFLAHGYGVHRRREASYLVFILLDFSNDGTLDSVLL